MLESITTLTKKGTLKTDTNNVNNIIYYTFLYHIVLEPPRKITWTETNSQNRFPVSPKDGKHGDQWEHRPLFLWDKFWVPAINSRPAHDFLRK
jgi:hypothetical protein